MFVATLHNSRRVGGNPGGQGQMDGWTECDTVTERWIDNGAPFSLPKEDDSTHRSYSTDEP